MVGTPRYFVGEKCVVPRVDLSFLTEMSSAKTQEDAGQTFSEYCPSRMTYPRTAFGGARRLLLLNISPRAIALDGRPA